MILFMFWRFGDLELGNGWVRLRYDEHRHVHAENARLYDYVQYLLLNMT